MLRRASSGPIHDPEMQNALLFDGYETIPETMDLGEQEGRMENNVDDQGHEVNNACAGDADVFRGICTVNDFLIQISSA